MNVIRSWINQIKMGVPKFYRWISERYPCLSEVVKEYQVDRTVIFSCSRHTDDTRTIISNPTLNVVAAYFWLCNIKYSVRPILQRRSPLVSNYPLPWLPSTWINYCCLIFLPFKIWIQLKHWDVIPFDDCALRLIFHTGRDIFCCTKISSENILKLRK